MSETSHRAPGEPPGTLVAALRHVLRPLVHLLLQHGVTYPFLCELLKALYADVAEKELPVPGKRQTDSRISLLTGLHRKDVRRLRGQPESIESIPESVSLGTQLVAMWLADRRYLDRTGAPKSLPRLKPARGGASFEELVDAVSRRDLRSRVVLDELVRLGVASVADDDRVTLNVEAFVPTKGFDEKAYYFGQNLHDHVAAAARNLLTDRPPFLERSVSYHGLSQKSVDELEVLAKRLGMDALKAVNRRALTMKRKGPGRDEHGTRMNFGVYFYAAEEDALAWKGKDDDS